MAKTDPLRFTIAFATMIEFVPRTGQGKGQNKSDLTTFLIYCGRRLDRHCLVRVFSPPVDPQGVIICPIERNRVRYQIDKYGNDGCSILSPHSSCICPENDRQRTTDRLGVLVRV